jgi:putative phage-type endonuclease
MIHKGETMTHDPGWYEARRGCVTASNAHLLMVNGKGKSHPWGVAAISYARRLAHQIVSGVVRVTPSNYAMQRGNDLEPEAIAWYAEATGYEVEHNTDPIPNESEPWIAATPDGIVNHGVGLVQVKCPMEEAAVAAWLTDEVDKEYFWQVQFEMWLTGAEWCDLLWYTPELEGPMPAGKIVRVDADYGKLAERVIPFRDYMLGIARELIEAGRRHEHRRKAATTRAIRGGPTSDV